MPGATRPARTSCTSASTHDGQFPRLGRPTPGDAIRALQLRTTTPEETREVAGVLAASMRPGDVVALTGEIGAGKTCFVQGAAAALGVLDRVTSPSFLLRKEYRGDIDVLHLDVYRLESMQEVLDVGFAEALGDGRGSQGHQEWVTFVEWGDAMAPLLPDEHLEVELHLPPLDTAGMATAAAAGDWEPEPRTLVLRPHGHDWTRRLEESRPLLTRWTVEDHDSPAAQQRAEPREDDAC